MHYSDLLNEKLFQTQYARQGITINVFFLSNMKATISPHVMIKHERICQATHFGVQLMKTTKVLESVEIVVPKVRMMHA